MRKFDNLKIQGSYDEIYDISKDRMMSFSLFLIPLVFVIESVFFVYYSFVAKSIPAGYFLLHYMAIPTLLNVIIYIFGVILLKKDKMDESLRRCIPIFVAFCISAVILSTHFAFTTIYDICIIPIMVSVVYGNKRVEKITFLASIFLMTFSFLIILGENTIDRPDKFFQNILISYFFIILGHFVSSRILIYEEEKELLLRSVYEEKEKLAERLLRDGLTKLYNVNFMYGILREYKAEKEENKVSLAILDIDFFKRVNDTYGHEVGNVVLKRLAIELKKLENENTFSCRYGGEEFVLIFYDKNKEEVIKLLESFRMMVENLVFEEMDNTGITISIGYGLFKEEFEVTEFVEYVDSLLYEAKRTGRNKVCY